MNVTKIRHKIPILTMIAAFALLAAGVLLIIMSGDWIEYLLLFAFTALLIVYGGIRFLQSVNRRKIKEGMIVLGVTWVAAIALMTFDIDPNAAAVVPSILVGAVALLMGILRLMICANCFINNIPGKFRNGISAIICIVFALFLLIHPIANFEFLTTVAGCYLIFYAVTMLFDAFAAIFESDLSEGRLRRRVHFAMPNIFTALKPANLVADINDMREQGKLEHGMIVMEKEQKDFDHINAEIMVHLTTQGVNKFGHVDISIGDTVFSYGTYDPSSVKLGGFISQGTMIRVSKLPYLKHCLDVQEKYVIGYGVCFSGQQLETIKEKIEETLANSTKLESEYDKAVKEGRGEDAENCKDSASNIVRLGGEVYVVQKGMFRRYFGINTNCVRFADWLLSESGIDAISFSGLRTPGAYYNMLENMFRRKSTRVVRKTAYILSKDIVLNDQLTGKKTDANI